MNVLITGGTGYIGSPTALLLAQAGHRVVLFDNLSNSTGAVLKRLALLGASDTVFEQGDVNLSANLGPCLLEHEIEAVVHLAGEKGPADSLRDPLGFHRQRLHTTFSLLHALGVMAQPTLVYASTAAVYGQPLLGPLAEHHPTVPLSPYGSAHRYAETVLHDMARQDPHCSMVSLRLFNVAGAHPSGLLGEEMGSSTVGLATELARVAAGRSLALYMNGHRLNTPDGSPERDYVHVMDVAQAIANALDYAAQQRRFEVFNVGSGQSHSVRQLVRAFEALTDQTITVLPGEASAGQPTHSQACLKKTRRLLGWAPRHSLEDLCHSSWNHLLTAIETRVGSDIGHSLPR
jgi:UDP-glucose 4-epimerase